MLCWLRAFAVCLLLATAGAALAAEVKPFAREDMASDAVRLTETLRADAAKIGALTKDKSPDDLRKAASAAAAAGKFDAAAEARRRRGDRRAEGFCELARLRQCRDQGRRRPGE